MRRMLGVLMVVVVGAAMTISGCSGGNAKEGAPASQVAVKVNDGELSIHQVNEQLARLPTVPAAQQDQARKRVVESLVDQELLVQKASEKKLDRDPDVLAALEQSRAQILASAYLQKTLASQSRPSEEMVRKYYADNPAMFAQRRVFRLQELSTDLPSGRVAELRAAVSAAKSLSEVAAWLQKNRAQVAVNSAVRGPEQLPLQQVPEIGQMKDGEMRVFANDGKLTVLQILASQSQPLDEAKAAPLIEQFLGTRRRDELARGEIKRLRESAKIQYVGEFAKLAQVEVPHDPAPVATEATPAASASSIVDKGVTGLR